MKLKSVGDALVDFATAERDPKKVVLYACVAFIIGASVVVANGFLVAQNQGSMDAILQFGGEGFEGNSPVFGIVLAALVYAACCFVERSFSRSRQGGRLSKLYQLKAPMAVLLVAVVIFLAWLPVLVAFYPGILYHDTVFQLAQFYGNEPLDVYTGVPNDDVPKITDHHPVMTTLLFSLFAWLGQLTGHAYAGLFLYVLVQAFALAVSLSAVLVYVRRNMGLSGSTSLVFGVFCAMFPLFPVYAASISKDVTFVPFFVTFSLLFIEVIRTEGKSFSNTGFVVAFLLVSLGMAVTKKVGIYIVIACMLVLFIRCRGRRSVALANGVLCAAAVFLIVPYGVFPLIDAGAGSSKETLSVPFEQTALYVKEHPDDVTPDERVVLDSMLTYDTLAERYRPATADYVKNFAPNEGGMLDYLGVYFQQGFRHPLTYLRAFLSLEAGFVGTTDPYLPLFESASYIELEKLDEARILDVYPDNPVGRSDSALAFEGVVERISQLPLIGLLFARGLYVFILPIVACVLIATRGVRRIVLLAPYVVFAALLFLSPVSTGVNAGRYVFPLLCLLPVVFGSVSLALRAPCSMSACLKSSATGTKSRAV